MEPKPRTPNTENNLHWPAKCKQLDIDLRALSEQLSALRSETLEQMDTLRQHVGLAVSLELDDKVTSIGKQSPAVDGAKHTNDDSMPSTYDHLCNKWWADKGERLVHESVAQALAKQSLSLDEVSEARFLKLETYVDQALASSTDTSQGGKAITQEVSGKRYLVATEELDVRLAKLETRLDEVQENKAGSGLSEKKTPQRRKKSTRAQSEALDNSSKKVDENSALQNREDVKATASETASSSGQPSAVKAQASAKTKLRAVTNTMISFPKEKAKARNRETK